ncbi:peptidase M56 family protein [Arthrobacter sp. KNU-44]|uniref:peptidase M56 family protein n=1 Tax=unclassified Arthrobacter TaxID=235627 RepID=UPI003F41F4AD
MNGLPLDEAFSKALRAELVSRVQTASPVRSRKRTRRLWIGGVALAGAGVLGGVGAAAAGFLTIPGGDRITTLAPAVTETHTGTASVTLGVPPVGANAVGLELTCLTPGRFEYEDGASSTCAAPDVGTSASWSGYTIKLLPGQRSVTIKTDPANSWRLTAKYIKREATGWGVNLGGNTFGAENQNGSPDLVAVMASNGQSGYAYKTDLDEADGTAAMKTFKSPEDALAWQEARRGKSFPVPVYESDGKTIIGEFVIK